MKPLFQKIQDSPGRSFTFAHFDKNLKCDYPYWHLHPQYEIVFVKNGSGIRSVGQHTSYYNGGTLIFIGPNIPHMPFSNWEKEDNYEVVIQMDQDFYSKIIQFPENRAIQALFVASCSGLIFGRETHAQVAKYIGEMKHLSPQSQLSHLMMLLTDMSEEMDICSMEVSGVALDRKQNDYGRINTVYDHVATHYTKEISVEDMAELVGLTKNSFCRFFKKVTTKSPIQFVNEYRLNQAASLLTTSPFSISEIMYQCGFNDPSFFTRQFRKTKGVTPTEFRKQTGQTRLLA